MRFRVYTMLPLLSATVLYAADAPMIAVCDFESTGLLKENSLVVSDQFRSELYETGRFRIIERSQMEAILKEQGFQQSVCTDDACAVEAGKLLGVKYMIVGSLGTAGSYTLINVRFIDVMTGEALLIRSERTTGGIDAIIDQQVAVIAKDLTKEYLRVVTVDNETILSTESLRGRSYDDFSNAAPPSRDSGSNKSKLNKTWHVLRHVGFGLVGCGAFAAGILVNRNIDHQHQNYSQQLSQIDFDRTWERIESQKKLRNALYGIAVVGSLAFVLSISF